MKPMHSMTYFILLLAAVGIVNNLLINYMQKCRSIAMYKSVSLSNRQNICASTAAWVYTLFWSVLNKCRRDLGQSGSGKSTLLSILGGLDIPTKGTVSMNGIDISRLNDEKMSKIRRQKIGFVFRFYNLIPNLNVEENIMLPLLLDG